MRISDWSSDVCSSDLQQLLVAPVDAAGPGRRHQHLAARQPVARVDDEKAQAPVGVVDQEVVDVADLAVARGDVIALDFDGAAQVGVAARNLDRSEEHTSELQSLMRISYAVFCLKKKKIENQRNENWYTKNRQ